MALNSWHTPTAREGESKFNHLCYKSPTALYYVHRWCLGSFAGWQCSACLMPGREQCFSSPGDSGKTLFFLFHRTMWVSNLSHFYISFKPTFQQKVKILLQRQGQREQEVHQREQMMHHGVKIYCKTEQQI